MRAPLFFLVWVSGTLAECTPTFASAQDTAQHLTVTTAGSCPDSAAVEVVLAGLLPTKLPPGFATPAIVADLGESYSVALGDRAKTYADAARDCRERARVAAAFISLALAPEIPSPAEKTPPAPIPPTPSRRTPPLAGWVRVDVRGTYQGAPESGLFAPGVALGIAAGRGWLGAQALCEWTAGASISATAGMGSILVERFPCAVGPVVRTSLSVPLEVTASAGAVIGALLARGAGFASVYESTRLEVGLRAALDATLHLGRPPGNLAPAFGFEAIYDPVPYDFVVLSRGLVGHTPPFWLGVNAGVSWSIP